MSNSFNINVSGGNVSFGAASQGDRSSTVGNAALTATIDAGARELYSLIGTLAQKAGAAPEARVAVESHAQELVAAVKAQDKPKVSAALELVQKNFSWAYPALKDFVKVAWPALLAAIGP